MTWIRTIEPGDAEGEIADIYRAIAAGRGGVAAVHRAQSLNIRALRAHLDLYKAVVFQRSTLSRIARERIAIVVSFANDCRYCVAHHAAALRQAGDDPNVAGALARGELPDALTPPDRLLLSWARRGATAPAEATAADLDSLRTAGFDDRALLDATLTVAYFAFVNRLVLLLGIELEVGYEATCGDQA